LIFNFTVYVPDVGYTTLTELVEDDVFGEPPLNVHKVVALFGMLELVFVKTIAWFKQMEIVLFAAGGLDVKSTTKFCPQTPTLLTIRNIESKKVARKKNLCVKVCKKPKIRGLIYEN
jgi:hypothetical protein